MKKRSNNWLTYWNDWSDLKGLLKAQDQIDKIYEEIKSSIGRSLMSEEMLEIQESLEQRIQVLTELKKSDQLIAA